jgi:hypothetical protein
MVKAKPTVEFIQSKPYAGPSGGLAAATAYMFRVNGTKRVTVTASSFVGRLTQEQVMEMARKQIETDLLNGQQLEDQAEVRLKI